MTAVVAEMLAAKIIERRARVVVVGLGYIGLPLLAELARAGFDAAGFDTDRARIAGIVAGRSLVEGVDASNLAELAKLRKIKLDSDPKIFAGADVVVIAVPTPFTESGSPNTAHLDAAVSDVLGHAHPGMLVVLESTSYPGTTREIAARISAAGFSVGENIFVAHSPERIDPGNASYGLKNTARVVGGITPECTRMTLAFYKQFVDEVLAVSSADTAEVVKLFENIYRAVNIGLVNEIAVASKTLGVDIWEVVEAAASKPFGFMKFLPGPGVGGPCVPAAPRAMSWKMGQFGDSPRFMNLAIDANRQMPAHVAGLLVEALAEDGVAPAGARVLVAGVAYKPDVADLRGSPALELFDLFLERKMDVFYIDSHVASFRHAGRNFESIAKNAAMSGYDAVVLVTAHTDFDVQRLVREAKLVIDTRNATGPYLATATARLVRL